ncbi:MAG: hypothetical protein JOZ39_11750 [Chloroflexi bacterium]|nr:hypothetical protein [Chloroflexota bacterium]
MIAMHTEIKGAGKGDRGWFPVTRANVGFDHASHTQCEHAILLDFVNNDLGPSARVALEMDIESGKALLRELHAAIEAAETSGFHE